MHHSALYVCVSKCGLGLVLSDVAEVEELSEPKTDHVGISTFFLFPFLGNFHCFIWRLRLQLEKKKKKLSRVFILNRYRYLEHETHTDTDCIIGLRP